MHEILGAYVERKPGVIGGHPVIRGRRIATAFIADLTRQGAPVEELMDDFDLSREEVEAALTFEAAEAATAR